MYNTTELLNMLLQLGIAFGAAVIIALPLRRLIKKLRERSEAKENEDSSVSEGENISEDSST